MYQYWAEDYFNVTDEEKILFFLDDNKTPPKNVITNQMKKKLQTIF